MDLRPHREVLCFTRLKRQVREIQQRRRSPSILEVDEARGYPEEFVKALTDAGWLAALIPEEYGGSGLTNGGTLHAEERRWHEQPWSVEVTLPPLGVCFVGKTPSPR